MSSILRISEAANLGIHALVFLSLERGCSPCSAGIIAKALGASESHLAKVMQRLVAADMVSSTRGARGGFSITIDPACTSLLAVLEAIDGPIGNSGCLLGRDQCLVHRCWLSELEHDAISLVQKHLGSVTLADVAVSPGRN
jgi:Rrf2 family nitric oxide-sensitive transcriptional repressor